MPLRTRTPSGQVAYPFLMVEGGEKDGKSHLALSLSASERVGRTFVFELGERTADEYAPLGRYEIVEHNGTYTDMLGQAHAVVAEPRVASDKPNVAIVDSDSMFWALHKDAASAAARRSQRAVKILEKDPDADIDVSSTYWNKAADKWWAFHNLLRAWDGITVLTVRAGLVTKFQNGQPVANQTEWSRDVQKGTPFAMTGIVRVGRRSGQPPKLVEVQSLHVDVPTGGLVLPAENTLEYLIFDLLGAGGGFTQSPVVNPVEGVNAVDAKNLLWADACEIDGQNRDSALKVAAAAWIEAGLEGRAEVTDDEIKAARALLTEVASRPAEPEQTDAEPPAESEAA